MIQGSVVFRNGVLPRYLGMVVGIAARRQRPIGITAAGGIVVFGFCAAVAMAVSVAVPTKSQVFENGSAIVASSIEIQERMGWLVVIDGIVTVTTIVLLCVDFPHELGKSGRK